MSYGTNASSHVCVVLDCLPGMLSLCLWQVSSVLLIYREISIKLSEYARPRKRPRHPRAVENSFVLRSRG